MTMKGIPVQELAFNLQRERARLFGLGSSRSIGPDNKRQKSKKGWTFTLFALDL